MVRAIRNRLADVVHWLSRHWLLVGAIVVVLVGAGVGAYLLATDDSDDERVATAPAPQVVVREVPAPEETEDLGFPAFATKNTTRVSGADPIADAAAVALAVDPSTGGVQGPDAVTLVDAADWPGGIAAASLIAAPVGAPILVTDSDEVPELTENAIRALGPEGSDETAGRQAFVIGSAATPDDLDTLEVKGASAAEVAAEVASLRERLTGRPDHLLLASSDEPAFAMPAAGWAARSGDPVLYVQRDSVPQPTRKALSRYKGVPVYVLGPTSAISSKAFREVEKLAPSAERVGAEEPVASAIEFARFASGDFGWNINDPGHGFVIANTERPLDAAVAAPLSASGTWGPLLVTEDGDSVPEQLRGYLLDLKPGYEQDPTRALYNHLWLIGDTSALSVDFQAQLDEIAEVAPVSSGSGASSLTPPPGTPESQPDTADDQGNSNPDRDTDQGPSP
ncbi:MAG: cell wall-binding repeat-containing protein [Solirubrobacterales bacterium]